MVIYGYLKKAFRKHNSAISDVSIETEENNVELASVYSEEADKKINGVNVTVPFKESVIDYLDILSPEANETQSVNTIYKSDNNINTIIPPLGDMSEGNINEFPQFLGDF